MNEADFAFLQRLLETPGPSGYEAPIQAVVREHVSTFAAEVETDWHGNVTAVVNPGGSPRIMLDGHCDQIGLLVKHIDDKGFVYVDTIGGWDVQMLLGQRVKIWTQGEPVTGVIARKAIHLLTPEERKQVPEIKDLWIDVGAGSGDEVREMVRIGDPITLELEFRRLRGDLACSVAMDDRVGVWVVMTALARVAERNPEAAVYAVSAVQEEIGLRGTKTSAYRIDPQLGIAVDVTHATDCPTTDPKQYGLVEVGGGPVVFRGPNVNPRVYDRLERNASDRGLPVQIGGIGRAASNDGNALQVNREGVATGIIGIPNRYMHSPVEVVSLGDLDAAANLIAEFCASVTTACDFTP